MLYVLTLYPAESWAPRVRAHELAPVVQNRQHRLRLRRHVEWLDALSLLGLRILFRLIYGKQLQQEAQLLLGDRATRKHAKDS